MSRGLVYVWTPDRLTMLGGRIRASIVPLERLEDGGSAGTRLRGQYVEVHNAGAVNLLDPGTNQVRAVPISDAEPNAGGDFLFEPGRGGGRLDKVPRADADFSMALRAGFPLRRASTATFTWIGLPGMFTSCSRSLQRRRCRVSYCRGERASCGHRKRWHGAMDCASGDRMGAGFKAGITGCRAGVMILPSIVPCARQAKSIWVRDGSCCINGALVEVAGGRYRANASHNAGILYHETTDTKSRRHNGRLFRGNSWAPSPSAEQSQDGAGGRHLRLLDSHDA